MALTPVIQIYTSDPELPGATTAPYVLTDHNRQPLQFSYEKIEDSARMADGTLRKFITANKKKIGITWQTVPAAGGRAFTADGNLGAAWLKSFYEEYVFKPIWIKLSYAGENWRYGKTSTPLSSDTGAATAANLNPTYLNTPQASSSLQYTFAVASAVTTTFSNGVASATLTTSAPHNLTLTNSPYIYVAGIDQIYNGAWQISGVTSNTITYAFGGNNASAAFNLNSYLHSGSTVTLNVDNNDFATTSMSVVISNTKALVGSISNINGTWVVTGKTGQNVITASNAGFSGSSNGYVGQATILASSSAAPTKSISSLNPAVIGPVFGSDVVKVFITDFSYNITKRFALTDYVDMSIEFTEI